MGVPTTTTGPTNVYYLIDDFGTSAGPTTGGPTGGTSGNMISPEFTAPSLAAATTVAYLFASTFQRPVRLVQKYGGSPPWTLVNGIGPNNDLTATPSGIGF